MALPTNRIKKIKLPNGTTYDIVPDTLGDGTYAVTLPSLTADSVLATETILHKYAVSYSTTQSLTLAQQIRARNNIGAGTLTSVKSINTTNSTALSTSSSEAISGTGTINLHKIAKTGSYSDLLNRPGFVYMYLHNITIAITGITGTTYANAYISFSFWSGVDSYLTDADSLLSELVESGFTASSTTTRLPASGLAYTGSGFNAINYIIYGIRAGTSNSSLYIDCVTMTNPAKKTFVDSTSTGTWVITDNIFPELITY